MRFTKMHGAGNDYIFIDGRRLQRDWPALSRAISDRHRGVGSDGLILALPSDRAHVRMRMFNADGSEAEMCGNGIRCLVSYAFARGIVPEDTSPVVVETMAGKRQVFPIWDGGRMTGARVDMGEPALAAGEVPVDLPGRETVLDYPLEVNGYTFAIGCVSMGNPHAVAFLDNPVDELPLHEIGPLVENHPIFPERVNFEIVYPVSEHEVKARVWERGSGLTMACGSGACAIGVIGRLKGLTGNEVRVRLPGGELVVRWQGMGEVVLEGPIEEVFEGEWPDGE